MVLAQLCSELDTRNEDQESEEETRQMNDEDIFNTILLDETGGNNNDESEKEINHVMTAHVNFCHDNDHFWGGCLGLGAQRTVIGKPQADTFITHIGIDNLVTKKNTTKLFRFGDNTHDCMGIIEIRL